jgi:putative spermidine/putrescine transport system permease protein
VSTALNPELHNRVPPARARRRQSAATGSVLFAIPAIVVLTAVFIFPLLQFLTRGFDDGFAAYRRLVTSSLYARVFLSTLEIAIIVTVVTVALAYPVASYLVKASPRIQKMGFIMILFPFWTSVLVRTYAWMIILGRAGPINETLLYLGLITEPLRMLNTDAAVIIGMVHVMLPLMVMPIYSSMRRLDGNLLFAAQSLGAGRFSTFRHVTLPVVLPGIGAGCALVFIISIGYYITPALLGGGKVLMIAKIIEQQTKEFVNWEFSSALSGALLLATLLLLSLTKLPGLFRRAR